MTHMRSIGRIFTLLLLLSAAERGEGRELTVSPGTLGEATAGLPAGDEDITLRGSADARDMAALRSLAHTVSRLDLGELEIVERTLPATIFAGATCRELVWPSGVTTVPEGAFSNSALTSLTFPAGVREMGRYALSGCGALCEVAGLDNLTVIGEGAFRGCSMLRRIPHLPSAERIGSEAFAGCSIESLWLPAVRALSPYALAGMESVTEVKLNPEADAGEGVLAGCSALKAVYGAPRRLPDLMLALSPEVEVFSLTRQTSTVGSFTFAGMHGLKGIDVSALGSDIPDTSDDAFEGVDCPEVALHVEPGHADAWRSHPVWGAFRITEEESGMEENVVARLLNVSGGKGWIRIEGDGRSRALRVYDLAGRELYRGLLEEPILLSTSGWSEGIVAVSAEGMAPVKILVAH